MTRDGGIFVKKEALHEDFDLEVYWHPFASWTWISITFCSITVTICILFLWKVPNLNPLKCTLEVQEAGSILKVCFALSKLPHFHRAYLVTVP